MGWKKNHAKEVDTVDFKKKKYRLFDKFKSIQLIIYKVLRNFYWVSKWSFMDVQ